MNTRFLPIMVASMAACLGCTITGCSEEYILGPSDGEVVSIYSEIDSPTIRADADQKRQALKAELSRLIDHAWAGDYYYGGGLGVNITVLLAPESGYIYEWYGCLGLYDRNYGQVTVVEDGALSLSHELPVDPEGFNGLPSRLVPVTWGDRRYLISLDRMEDFCKAVKEGSEPRESIYGFFLLRDGDHTKPAPGLPEIPEPFLSDVTNTLSR